MEWITYENLGLIGVLSGVLALVLSLYVVKSIILRVVHSTASAALTFAAAASLCVPITWFFGDWRSANVYPIGNYIGIPIIMLTVPTASFFFDLSRRASGKQGGWYWRVPIEVLVGIPLWGQCWVLFEFWVLGWIWI